MSSVETMTKTVMFKKIRGPQHNHKKLAARRISNIETNWNKIQN